MKVLIKSPWGSDESTKGSFAFLHANAFAEAGHEVRLVSSRRGGEPDERRGDERGDARRLAAFERDDGPDGKV